VTPEGVVLHLELPSAGERIGALATDIALIAAILIAFSLAVFLAALATGFGSVEPYLIIWLLGAFVLRNFWFIYFESGPRGATPGKRWFGLRVAARNGEPLSPDAVVARNLMRELELFLPLSALAYRPDGGPVSSLTALLALGWTLIFLLFPLFNRDRLRIGDLIAGTLVVRAPRAPLQADATERGTAPLAFTGAQLAVYGVFELQTLEDVLRRARSGGRPPPGPDPLGVVAQTIRKRIGWTGQENDRDFLAAYYAAVRSRLESEVLFGRRRRDKRDR
jgi:uncharacterized RDD family membrane protein YckC